MFVSAILVLALEYATGVTGVLFVVVLAVGWSIMLLIVQFLAVFLSPPSLEVVLDDLPN
jgi:hypothetical protein